MIDNISLDRAAVLDIVYPIGVNETITFTYSDLLKLTDTYEVIISCDVSKRKIFKTYVEGVDFFKTDNIITWIINIDYPFVNEQIYFYELRNLTRDFIEIKGEFKATKTIK